MVVWVCVVGDWLVVGLFDVSVVGDGVAAGELDVDAAGAVVEDFYVEFTSFVGVVVVGCEA